MGLTSRERRMRSWPPDICGAAAPRPWRLQQQLRAACPGAAPAPAQGFVVGTDVNSLALIARESDSRPYRMERTFQIEAPSGMEAACRQHGSPESTA